MIEKKVGVIQNKQSRNYGIDALRIISMLMVVLLHLLENGGILEASKSTNYWVSWFFLISAYGAVNIYALISGYVGIYSKYRLSNLAVLWCRVAYYSILIAIICKCIYPNEIGIGSLLFSFFPILSYQYWYFSAYALLFLFIPILNEGLHRLSKKGLGILLLIIITATSVFYPVVTLIFGDVFGLKEGFSTLWLMIVYLIGGYIRKYGLIQKIKTHRTRFFLIMYFAFVLLTWLSKLCIQFVSIRIWGEIRYDELLISYPSITILGSAVCLLLAFEQINLRLSVTKVISFISPLTFSVYLIHHNKLIRGRLWFDKFTWIAELPAYQMIPLVIGLVVLFFMLCIIIDLLRHYLFRGIKLKERLNNLESSIRHKISDKDK